jgi:carboxypeptidase family protein/uncharacterized protein DUF2442
MPRPIWEATMRGLVCLILSLLFPVCLLAPDAMAQTLSGRVTSAEEGPMEGVLVSAKRTGSTITVTVVSDAQGRYAFPATKLEPGPYALRIRAVGYDLDTPAAVDIRLAWSPRLADATSEQRKNWRLIGRGQGIHWPDVDEDISIASLLKVV